MKAIKLGSKRKRKKRVYFDSAMKAEKKNAEGPYSAFLPCGEKVYFLFIFYKYKPRIIYNNKKEEITKESETTLLKIPINNELYTEMYQNIYYSGNIQLWKIYGYYNLQGCYSIKVCRMEAIWCVFNAKGHAYRKRKNIFYLSQQNLILLFILCIQIYEIGGGSGTCAKCIMDYIMLHAPARVYNSMIYMYVHSFSSFTMRIS